METALFLGAGFSKWAAGVPVAKELFDFEIAASVTDSRKLSRLKLLYSAWLENVPESEGPLSEKFIGHSLAHASENDREILLWYIGRRLTEPFIWYRPFGRRRTLTIDETYKDRLPGISKARNFLQRFSPLTTTGILTTNYDLLIEYSLGSQGFNYGVRGEQLHGAGGHPLRREAVILNGKTPLAKLHGSISWDPRRRYTDGRRALTGNALIVAPTHEKEPEKTLLDVWTLAASILNRSERIVVFGFAFNPYDTATLDMLAAAGGKIRRVELFDISPPIAAAQAVWPKAEIVARPPELANLLGSSILARANFSKQ